MKLRNILIGLIVIAAGISGGVSMFTRPVQTSGGKSIVSNRPSGVAYAQEGGGGGAPPPPPGGGGGAPPPPPGGGAPPPGGGAAPPAGDAAASDAAAPAANLSDEEWLKKLEEWKNSDPRDILKSKYKDLQSKETHPDNEDDPEQYIPETSRVDPMTIVNGAIPDELKPPRSGETDVNEAETYLYSAAASGVVDFIGVKLQVFNVLQIGLSKIVSVGLQGGRRFNLHEGEGRTIILESKDGIPVQATFSLTSASVKEVVISVTGQPWGSTVTITKDFHYIPVN